MKITEALLIAKTITDLVIVASRDGRDTLTPEETALLNADYHKAFSAWKAESPKP